MTQTAEPTTTSTYADVPTFQLFIAGEWIDSSSGETFESRNPANTRDVVGRLQAQHSGYDVAVADSAVHGPVDADAFQMLRLQLGVPTVLQFSKTIQQLARSQPANNAMNHREWITVGLNPLQEIKPEAPAHQRPLRTQ